MTVVTPTRKEIAKELAEYGLTVQPAHLRLQPRHMAPKEVLCDLCGQNLFVKADYYISFEGGCICVDREPCSVIVRKRLEEEEKVWASVVTRPYARSDYERESPSGKET
jgi:hypothetical protein